MQVMKTMCAAILLIWLTGCAAPPPKMTRQEYLQTVQRTYQDKTPEDIFAAAEKILTLMDGEDFEFHHTEDSVIGMRKWLIFALIAVADGTDVWTIKAKKAPAGTLAMVSVATNSSAAVPMPTTGGDFTMSGSSMAPGQVGGTALYDLFWARMDYMLGIRDEWMTCEQAKERLSAGKTTGNLLQVCDGVTIDDKAPGLGDRL